MKGGSDSDRRRIERALRALWPDTTSVRVRSLRLVARESAAGRRRRKALAGSKLVPWWTLPPQRRALCMCQCMEPAWSLSLVVRGPMGTQRWAWADPNVTAKHASTRRAAMAMFARELESVAVRDHGAHTESNAEE